MEPQFTTNIYCTTQNSSKKPFKLYNTKNSSETRVLKNTLLDEITDMEEFKDQSRIIFNPN